MIYSTWCHFVCLCSGFVQSGDNPYMPMAPVNREQEALLISTDTNEGNEASSPLYALDLLVRSVNREFKERLFYHFLNITLLVLDDSRQPQQTPSFPFLCGFYLWSLNVMFFFMYKNNLINLINLISAHYIYGVYVMTTNHEKLQPASLNWEKKLWKELKTWSLQSCL